MTRDAPELPRTEMAKSKASLPPAVTTRAASRSVAKTPANASAAAPVVTRRGKGKARATGIEKPLPFRISAPERLPPVKACTWGTRPLAMQLLMQREMNFAGRHAASSSADCDGDNYQCHTRPEKNTINLRTRDPFHTEIFFKCKPTTELRRLFAAYLSRNSHLNLSDVAFSVGDHVGDRTLTGEETPADLALEDNDVIHVTFLNVGQHA